MAKKETSDRWRRLASDAALVSIYGIVMLALFGGFAFEHVTQSMTAEIALVSMAMAALVGAGIWLDGREARREGALPED